MFEPKATAPHLDSTQTRTSQATLDSDNTADRKFWRLVKLGMTPYNGTRDVSDKVGAGR